MERISKHMEPPLEQNAWHYRDQKDVDLFIEPKEFSVWKNNKTRKKKKDESHA